MGGWCTYFGPCAAPIDRTPLGSFATESFALPKGYAGLNAHLSARLAAFVKGAGVKVAAEPSGGSQSAIASRTLPHGFMATEAGRALYDIAISELFADVASQIGGGTVCAAPQVGLADDAAQHVHVIVANVAYE